MCEVSAVKICICDDDPLCRGRIKAILQAYQARKSTNLTISVYENGTSLLDDACRSGGFDIYLLDILMPDMNGIRLGTELRQFDPYGKIIYLTDSREYALEAYQARPFDYILKPANEERLFAVLDEVIGSVANRREKSLIIRTRENNTKLGFDSILYAELADRRIRYHLAGSGVVESSTIRIPFAEAIGELLQDGRFVLCGAGLAVNLFHITAIDNEMLFFKNGSKLYIGKRAGRDLRSAWSDFWLSEEGEK